MKKKYFYIGAFILIAICAVASYQYYSSREAEKEQFKFAKIEIKDIIQSVSANGTINPVSMISVGTQVSGTVKQLFVDYNSYVTKGQILAELDPVLFRSQLAQSKAEVVSAEASLELAEANFRRSTDLFNKGYISKQEFDESIQKQKASKASLDIAKAKEQKEQSNLNFSIIRSPVSGTVVDRQVDVGQTVAASFQTPTLFKIAKDLRKMQIDTNFAEADIGKITVGQKATFTVDAYPNKIFDGVVTQIRLSPTIQQNVVTYDVVIGLDNPDETLKPGMTAFVNVITAEAKNTLSVANAALRFKPSGFERNPKNSSPKKDANVYVLSSDTPTPVKIQTGISDGKFTQILAGDVKEGDEVIVSENTKDKAGAKSPPRMF